MNPDLGPVGIDTSRPSVPALAAITPPLPSTQAQEARSYVCTIPNASMHRTDGKRLGFVFGFLTTQFAEDIKYLEAEIAAGNIYVRQATADEINNANMRLDPRGTMEKQVRAQLEPQLRAELEARIRAEMLTGSGVNLDAAKVAGVDAAPMEGKLIETPGAQVVLTGAAAAQMSIGERARLAAAGKPIPPAPLMTQAVPPLQGIVGTADISGGAVDSNSVSGK